MAAMSSTPNECATSTVGPCCQDRTSFVASTLACRLVSGFCTAVAFKPQYCSPAL
jgi:hypothetical protein